MLKQEYSCPQDFFEQSIIDSTYSFIETLSANEIRRNRAAYKRELNASNERNELPPHTQEMRRCFLYLTHQYERHGC